MLKDTLIFHKKTVFLIAYPCFKTRNMIKSKLLLYILSILKNLSFAEIIVDFIDPPILMTEMYIKQKYLKKFILLLRKGQEKKYLLHSILIITNSDKMSDFLRDEYNLDSNKFLAISMGINVSDFPPNPERFYRNKFTVIYGSTIAKDRGITSLIKCIEYINKKYPVNLFLCGRIVEHIEFPEVFWLKVFSKLNYKEYCDIVIKHADIGIIPYPDNDWWGRVTISKMATYLAAGIPVISTNLLETAQFIKSWKCGMVASSCEEMEHMILSLYENREECVTMGNNAIKAAEMLDWSILAKRLHKQIELLIT